MLAHEIGELGNYVLEILLPKSILLPKFFVALINCLLLQVWGGSHEWRQAASGSKATGVNMMENEKMDISKEEHPEILPRAEEEMDAAKQEYGVGPSSQQEKEMDISDQDFRNFASILKMDMPELKGWFVKSEYKAEEFREFFETDCDCSHPLHIAAWEGAVDMVDMLITKAKVDVNIKVDLQGVFRQGCAALHFLAGRRCEGWTALHFAALGNYEELVYRLVVMYGADPNVQSGYGNNTPLHEASRVGCLGAVEGFLRAECELCHQPNVNATNSREFPRTKLNKVNVNVTNTDGQTALHSAAHGYSLWKREHSFAEVVQTLLKFPDIKLSLEDKSGRTALDIASEINNWEVFKILRLKITPEVTDYNEPYYRDRQASVDAANAILVGAALIASVTFAAWLQPPLGYSTYYNEQYSNSLPAPPASNPQYASFDHHPLLKWFWAFNSFSFFLAIATVMSGAQSVLPSHMLTVKQEVAKLQRNLLITSTLLALSMIFVLLAFAIAGVIVVPPVYNFRASMYFTILIGGGVSVVFLLRLVLNIFRTAFEMWGYYGPFYFFNEYLIIGSVIDN